VEHKVKKELEMLLRRRGLGATLDRHRTQGASAPAGAWDELRGGTITEIVPEARDAAGVTSLALYLTARHGGDEWRAWVDPQDRFDPDSAERAGLKLDNVLWLRGGTAEMALEGAQQIVQAGRFRVVVIDFLEQEKAGRLARAVWFRLLRAVEREGQASVLVLGTQPLPGTFAERVLAVGYESTRWVGSGYVRLAGVRMRVQTVGARRGPESERRAAVRSEEFVA
jgi:cell division inhibitor SulA